MGLACQTDFGVKDTAIEESDTDTDTDSDTDTDTDADSDVDTDTGDTNDTGDIAEEVGITEHSILNFSSIFSFPFWLPDENSSSSTYQQPISPRDYVQKVTGWYFIKST